MNICGYFLVEETVPYWYTLMVPNSSSRIITVVFRSQ